MLTNPSTLGVFERKIKEIAGIVHEAGGLLYYDGANLNAILGKVRPGDMGFDVIHMNLHKTFSTPHGGGGPGAGPVGDDYRMLDEQERPQTMGRLSAFMGNAGVLLRAYVYARMLGREGMVRVAEFATLNANYMMARLQQAGFDIAYKDRRATHEFILTLKKQAPVGLWFPCPDHVFPAIGAGVSVDRTDRNRGARSTGRLHRRDERDSGRGQEFAGDGDWSTPHNAGAAAG